jgi:peptidoglycan/LPS O-acetylase OafA/YrhL
VTIFFVISGYIVPDSMLQAGYAIAAWPKFMLERQVRLEPPDLASLVGPALLYRYVERPCLRLAARIRYGVARATAHVESSATADTSP